MGGAVGIAGEGRLIDQLRPGPGECLGVPCLIVRPERGAKFLDGRGGDEGGSPEDK